MWLRDQCVTWLFGWVSLILSHHPAKFKIHRSCESWDITLIFVMWPRYRNVTWLCWWGPLILSHHPAKFGVRRQELETMAFVISVPIPIPLPISIPMPRFQCQGSQMAKMLLHCKMLIVFADDFRLIFY